MEDARERARFIDAIDARNMEQRERERRERRSEEAQRLSTPPTPSTPPAQPPPPPPPQALRPPPRPQAPRPALRPAEPTARDLLEVSGAPQRRAPSGSTVSGVSAPSGAPSFPNTRSQPARLSDTVPAEARARIDEFLKTGRLDTRPFSFAPIDALAAPRPTRAAYDPPPLEQQQPSPPKPQAEPQPAKAGLDNRLPFEFAAPLDLPGNRFDLLPVSLSAVQLGGPNR